MSEKTKLVDVARKNKIWYDFHVWAYQKLSYARGCKRHSTEMIHPTGYWNRNATQSDK